MQIRLASTANHSMEEDYEIRQRSFFDWDARRVCQRTLRAGVGLFGGIEQSSAATASSGRAV
jgi:hypothetical protein